MCFMNCPYENFQGECINEKMQGTALAYCVLDEEPDEDNALDN